MSDFKCDQDDCTGYLCVYHGLRVEVKEYIDKLEEDLMGAIEQYEHWEKEIAEQDIELNRLEAENAVLKREIGQWEDGIRKALLAVEEQE